MVLSILRELHGKERISEVVLPSVIAKNLLPEYESFKNLLKNPQCYTCLFHIELYLLNKSQV